ncbi:ribonuclease HI [Cyanothece sp. BG0011]|uniref:ribonuclease HI n=1 Tax=Cyanothece sp. BG0011 TaxID=2082950 RepID=UPI000D1F357E|nr:ribonuclease HI [Cyanothece sp. BG0011]
MKKVQIYTDGACSGNPGKGGYGIILVYNEHRKELSGGYRLTTNNRMEMMAAIIGLEALKMPCEVSLYTDSRYLVDAITKGWAKKWQANGWKRNTKETAKNPDLWQKLLTLCEEHEVKFIWVKGHAGHSENEQCDRLAVTAAQQSELAIDEIYEQQ